MSIAAFNTEWTRSDVASVDGVHLYRSAPFATRAAADHFIEHFLDPLDIPYDLRSGDDTSWHIAIKPAYLHAYRDDVGPDIIR